MTESSADSDSGNIVEILTQSERDQRILQLRLAGVAVRRIGKQFRMSDKSVLAALDRTLPAVDAVSRARLFKQDLATLDQLQAWWFAQAKTSPTAAGIVLKILERRSQMCGLDAPVRLDPIQITTGGKPQQSSTAQLLAALDAIAKEPQAPVLRLVSDVSDDPPSEPPAAG